MTCPLGYGAKSAGKSEKKTFSVLGFQTEVTSEGGEFTNQKRDAKLCNYTDYIQTEALLKLQEGESIMKPEKTGMKHHEELLFIVTHQSIELWFKVLLKDLVKARDLLDACYKEKATTESSGSWKDLALVGHYLRRATMIFHHAANTFAVLQTMHPADFLEFRDFLVPASGFQSCQFREIEILLGLNDDDRAMCNDSHVFTALQDEQVESCRKLISEGQSLRKSIEDLLLAVNVPAEFLPTFYECTEKLHVLRQKGPAFHSEEVALKIAKEQTEEVRSVIVAPDSNLPADHPSQARAAKVIEAALYVSSYRSEHPQYAVLSETLDELVALEEGLLLFRSRHLHNVERVIGRRPGTGGSSGVEYLEKTREYRIFTPLWSLRKVFIRSSILPPFAQLHPGATADFNFFRKPENGTA
ncbi:Tryptophan 2 [Diplonema papillatum]|nr:Tryptophan 2 [Diplonema papillatum]|eukprot:gene19409-29904_t